MGIVTEVGSRYGRVSDFIPDGTMTISEKVAEPAPPFDVALANLSKMIEGELAESVRRLDGRLQWVMRPELAKAEKNGTPPVDESVMSSASVRVDRMAENVAIIINRLNAIMERLEV